MKKLFFALAVMTMLPNIINAGEEVKIGKSNIKLDSRMMTPEALDVSVP